MTAAPNKAERQKCWQARDAFWKCLDESADDIAKCKAQRKLFEANCTAQWASFLFYNSFVKYYADSNRCRIVG